MHEETILAGAFHIAEIAEITTFTTTILIYALMPDIFYELTVQRQRIALKFGKY